jgi:signal transduction histidine kinase
VVEGVQVSFKKASGERVVGLLSAAPMRGVGGAVVGAIVSARDVTEREREKEDRRELAARLLTVREDGKSRIARDLHDDLGQLLTALKMDLRWIERRLGEMPASDAVNELLDRAVGASALADQTIAAVQRVAAELRPPALSLLGLEASLAQEADNFRKRTGIDCTATLAADLPALSESVSTALYRIAQEALTNVARHADAHRAEVQLEVAGDQLTLRVSDDGYGFPLSRDDEDGLGLLGMRERALAIGGELNVESGAGKGTVVKVRLPLSKVRAEAADAR